MSKGLKYFFISCSLLLVLGHSVVPHNHEEPTDQLCEIKATQALSLVDILKLALSNNLGANHFEEFKDVKKVELSELLAFDVFIADLFVLDFNKCIPDFFELIPELPRSDTSFDCLLIGTPLRAPPSFA